MAPSTFEGPDLDRAVGPLEPRTSGRGGFPVKEVTFFFFFLGGGVG